jgi:predicted DNA-binding transcriptional regulator AlpA
VTSPSVPAEPPQGKRVRLITARKFQEILDCSPMTLYRLQREDPRFPKPGRRGRHTRVWNENRAYDYAEILANDTGEAA